MNPLNLFGLIKEIFKPAADLIDSMHTSEEEKIEAQAKLERVQNEVSFKLLEAAKQLLDAQTQIVVAEARGESWLQQSWRPITMLVFLGLVVCDSFGWLPNPLADEAWVLLQIGLGGYVTSRGVEKWQKEKNRKSIAE